MLTNQPVPYDLLCDCEKCENIADSSFAALVTGPAASPAPPADRNLAITVTQRKKSRMVKSDSVQDENSMFKYFEENNEELGCRRALSCPSTKKRNHKMLIKGTLFSRRNAIDISDEE